MGGARLGEKGVVVSPGAPALPGGLTASSWLVADVESGQVLAGRDPHGHFLPASTLKILTALTELPRLDLEARIRPSPADVTVDGNKVPLSTSVAYPVKDLFAHLLMSSANDAANALATADGGREATLSRMNEQARYLQADDTRATTPSGLGGPGESSSAYDLALFARAALQLPKFARLVASPEVTVTGQDGRVSVIRTQNKLLAWYPGAIGVKPGYTVAAQATFVGAARRDGHTLVVTVMHAKPYFWPEVESLLDWGFAADGRVQPVGQLAAPRPGPAPNAGDGVPGSAAAGRQGRSSRGLVRPVGIAVAGLAAAGLAAGLGVVGVRRRARRGQSGSATLDQ